MVSNFLATSQRPVYKPHIMSNNSLCSLILKMRFPWIANTGRERLIRSHSSAMFCFELSGNSN